MTRGYRFANALATKIAGRFSASRLRTKSDRLLAPDSANIPKREAVCQPLENRRLPGIALATTGLWRGRFEVRSRERACCLPEWHEQESARLPALLTRGPSLPRRSHAETGLSRTDTVGRSSPIAAWFLSFHFGSVPVVLLHESYKLLI